MWVFVVRKGAYLVSQATSLGFALLLVGMAASPSLLAQEKNEARFEGELSVEFESDHTFRSDDPNAEITDSFPTIGLGASWVFNHYFSVNGSFVTGKLDNYSLTLDGHNIAMLPGIAWHLGYSHQAKGKTAGDLSDEDALVVGLYGSHALSDKLSLEWVGEFASIEDVGGSLNNVIYYTLGGVVTFAQRDNLAVAHTTRAFDISGESDFDDTSTQISVGVEVYDGWTVDVGYTIAEVANVESETVGVLLAKIFAFNTPD
ncbi:MAG: hypothetical protein L3J67_09010 [Hyphomicrobiaceae bacterium]|nr:hypothetical protein [Hyphomicrobiaceae bacterium]